MQPPQISVIMPAYNASAYLGASIESVRQQSGLSWELLIVDDGSTDKTLDIAHHYASLDSRIRVMRNDGQKGPGGPRNTGLRAARGKTIFFLDSDDLLLCSDALYALWECLDQSTCPVVRGQGKMFCHQRWLISPEIFHQGTNSVTLYAPDYPRYHFCTYLYNADFLSRYGITFPEDLIVGEDTIFLCHVYSHLTMLPVINKVVHLYRINHKPTNPSAAKAMAATERVIRSRELLEKQGKNELVKPYLEHIFFPEWQQWLYSALMAGRDQAETLMQQWSQLLSGQEEALMPVLREQLGLLAIPFLSACEKQDTTEMLAILNKSGRIRPSSYYIGIDRPAIGWDCCAYLFLRRLRSLFFSRKTRRTLLYLFMMHKRSRSTLFSFSNQSEKIKKKKDV